MRHLLSLKRGVIAGLLAAAVAFVVIYWVWVSRRVDALIAERHEFCQRQVGGLESNLSTSDHFELRAVMRHHYLDQATLKLCLGSEIPLDEKPAATCWIRSGADDCYLTLGKELRKLYRMRYR